jgi:Met-zincin/Domain of unknown function (DUF5117)
MRRYVFGSVVSVVLAAVLGLGMGLPLHAQQGGGGEAGRASEPNAPPKTIEEKTEGMEKLDGFVPIYWNEKDGKLWLEISRFDTDILHYTSLPAGFGENTLGLNRGDLGPSHVIQWKRVGPRILMTQANQRYRASTDNAMERKSVDDGFPQAVHWGFTVAAETDGRVLVDATDFFMNDWHGIIQSLKRSNQGSFKLDKSRSAAYLPRTRAFPTNSEIEVTLTFTSDQPGGVVRSVAASGGAVTVRQHHSFVELPELGSFEPRRADPRAGFGGISYMDYSVPIGEPLRQRFANRHRLEKVDPGAATSPAVEPIVYYLDPGTPEPVRTALLEGGQWWNQAFTAAGYENAFRMEVLPDSADPMDARYNVVQWVHRSTRGWSYGASISDPRTGEILKGHVTLGSLRVRQDYLIAEAMLSPYEEDGTIPGDMAEMALLRIRQLSAHEIGHTLGLAHNYIASAQRAAGNMSVMDYPHPRVELDGGRINVLNAYERGIGEWDKTAITWGYQDFPAGTDEAAALNGIISEARGRGVTFVTDQDARPQGSAHPQAHLWDNGTDAATELDRMMEVRHVALDRLSEKAIRMGQPMATIEEALVPLYLHHRFQTEAAVKVVGGLSYTYALRGDGQTPVTPVSGDQQRRALQSVLATLDPAELVLPEDLLRMIPPRPFGYGLQPELFRRYTGLVFDAVSPAAAAADMTVSLLLNPQRAARLIEQSSRDSDLPSFLEMSNELMAATFSLQHDSGYEAEVSRAVERVVVDRMMGLAQRAAMPQVRAEATMVLRDLQARIAVRVQDTEGSDRAHLMLIASDIQRFVNRPMEAGRTPGVLPQPPGSPIGDPGMMWGGDSWSGLSGSNSLQMDGLIAVPGLVCSWH